VQHSYPQSVLLLPARVMGLAMESEDLPKSLWLSGFTKSRTFVLEVAAKPAAKLLRLPGRGRFLPK